MRMKRSELRLCITRNDRNTVEDGEAKRFWIARNAAGVGKIVCAAVEAGAFDPVFRSKCTQKREEYT